MFFFPKENRISYQRYFCSGLSNTRNFVFFAVFLEAENFQKSHIFFFLNFILFLLGETKIASSLRLYTKQFPVAEKEFSKRKKKEKTPNKNNQPIFTRRAGSQRKFDLYALWRSTSFQWLEIIQFHESWPFPIPRLFATKKKNSIGFFFTYLPFPYRESLKITRNKNRRLLPHFDQKHLQPRNKISSRIKSYLLNCKRMLFNASRNYQLWPFSPWKWRKARSVQGISFPIMNIALRFHEPDRKACFIYEN